MAIAGEGRQKLAPQRLPTPAGFAARAGAKDGHALTFADGHQPKS
jgi:hypothetical protein